MPHDRADTAPLTEAGRALANLKRPINYGKTRNEFIRAIETEARMVEFVVTEGEAPLPPIEPAGSCDCSEPALLPHSHLDWFAHSTSSGRGDDSAKGAAPTPAQAVTSLPGPSLDVERLAEAYTRIRGAHNAPDAYGEGPPCDWCRLAAKQHVEVIALLSDCETE